jgi:hypothetical protein
MPAKKTTTVKAAKKAAKKRTAGAKLTFGSAEELHAYVVENAEKDAYRMVARPKQAPVSEAKPDEPPTSASGNWSNRPSVPNQLTKLPDTVRTKATETRQFVLSNQEHLDEWNELQKRMHPMDAPSVRLTTYESQFAPSIGSFVLHVSYAELEYQNLV